MSSASPAPSTTACAPACGAAHAGGTRPGSRPPAPCHVAGSGTRSMTSAAGRARPRPPGSWSRGSRAQPRAGGRGSVTPCAHPQDPPFGHRPVRAHPTTAAGRDCGGGRNSCGGPGEAKYAKVLVRYTASTVLLQQLYCTNAVPPHYASSRERSRKWSFCRTAPMRCWLRTSR